MTTVEVSWIFLETIITAYEPVAIGTPKVEAIQFVFDREVGTVGVARFRSKIGVSSAQLVAVDGDQLCEAFVVPLNIGGDVVRDV